MTLHKLSAGSGYTYLTRHVARHDLVAEPGNGATRSASLAAYYTERGEAPGVWLGRGLAGLAGGPLAGEVVGEGQMVALFGHGQHPNHKDIPLGAPFTVRPAGTRFAREFTERVAAHNTSVGLPPAAPVDAGTRARLRSELGAEWFIEAHGRVPDTRELTDFLATVGPRRGGSSIAGYDLTFSPVKSVSALWALADPVVAAQVQAAHDAAVRDVLGWLEDTAVFTRLGRNGIRQVDVTGLVAVAFTHRDSRTGDPDLHTHVAISNKVQTPDGRWRALDGRVLHKAAVAASERYNTRLEAQLVDRLGVTFTDRTTGRGKRAVREITGIDPDLLEVFSARRRAILDRHGELAAQFTRTHGRAPDAGETHDLFDQANLMTRPAKPGPRSLAEQRTAWRAQAVAILGDEQRLEVMLASVTGRATPTRAMDRDWPERAAREAVATVSSSRATWQIHHVRAEVERLARTDRIPLAELDLAVQRAVDEASSPAVSIPLGSQHDGIAEPAGLRRLDGASVFSVAGSQLYTTPAVLAAESRLLAAADLTDGVTVPAGLVELSLLEARVSGRGLNPAQEQLVRDLASSGRRVQLALAPAGTGKTTALGALAGAWRDSGGTVIGLAPSAVAAAELRAALGGEVDTIAKLLHGLDTNTPAPALAGIDEGTLVVIDEAGMAGTFDLDRVVGHVLDHGGSVRLVGDTRQLAAIASGGVLRDIARTYPVATLDAPVRFADPVEGYASLALRVGDPIAFGYYLDHDRIHAADRTTTLAQAFTAWAADRAAGREVVLLAATNTTVRELNVRARGHRVDGQPTGPEVVLHDGTRASAGDLIVTRRNNRQLALSSTDWVKNGDRWQIHTVTSDGSLQVRHLVTRRTITLPAGYVCDHVQLGYATTIHLAQGRTADTAHTVLTGRENHRDLYVAMTRGRDANHLYLDITAPLDPTTPDALVPPTSIDVLERILARDPDRASATSQHQADIDPATVLRRAVDRYLEAVAMAGGEPGGEPRPLPWLPALPDTTGDEWARYLQQRHQLVTTAAARIHPSTLPDEDWADHLRLNDRTLARELAIWRAATGCDPDHPDPTGPDQSTAPGYREHLHQRVQAVATIAYQPHDWTKLLRELDPRITTDPSCPWLIRALTRAAHTGYNTPARLPALINDNQPLPDQHPARALLYRLAQDWPQTITPPPGTRRRDRDNDRLAVEAIRYHERSADRSMERDR